MADIVNLNKARKAAAKAAKPAKAAANRAKFGRSKAEKTREAAEQAKLRRIVDGAALPPDGADNSDGPADDQA